MGTTTKEIGGSSFNDMISSVDRRSEYVENRAGANVRLNNFLTPYTLDDKSSILNAPCGYSNGVYPSLRPSDAFGPELVTNGDFATDSDWTKTNATISNGVATVTVTSGGFSAINQNITYVSGKKYRITAQIQGSSGSSGKQIKFQDRGNNTGGLTILNATITLNETLQNINITWTANSNSTEIVISRQTNSGDYSWTIDNISIKEDTSADFDFTRGSAATRVTKDGLIKNVQILSGELVQNGDFSQIGSEKITNGNFSQIGSELVVNGDFSDSSWWGLDPVWSISNGSANCNGSGVIYKGGVLTIGKSYKVEVEISSYTSGTLTYPNASYTLPSAVGSYTFYYKANSQTVSFTGTNFIGSIDNVSVKEVGQDWDFTDGATITDNGVRIVSDGTYQRAAQYNVLTVGKQYKIQYEILENNSGNLKLQTSLGIIPIPSTVGIHTVYGEALQTFLTIERSGACDITITNISVKEVGQNWTLGSGWSMGDGIVEANNTSSFINQSGLIEASKLYRLTFEARLKSGTNGTINAYIGGSNNKQFTIANTDWQSFTYEDTRGSSIADSIYFNNNGTELELDNISVIEVTDDTDLPRIDYTGGTGSLLLEPQSTNLITYSEDFSEWSATNIVLTEDLVISPDGTTTADKIAGTPVTSQHRVNFTSTNVSGATTFSFFAKSGEYTSCWARISSSSAYFDLENGVSSEGSGITSSIENYGNGWYRCIMTKASSSANEVCRINITTSYLDTSDFLGDDTSGIYLWGAQHEALSYATSYIPTSGSSVTRNADVCNNAGSSNLINSTEGVLYAEVKAFEVQPDFFISMNDGTQNNRVIIKFSESVDNQLTAFTINSTNLSSITHTISNFKQYNKIALSYSSLYLKLYVNGQEVGTSVANPNLAVGLNVLNLSNQPTDKNVKGNVKCVAVFNEALTDEELAKITSTTQQEAFYEMRDKMLQINADYYEFGDYTTRLKKLF